MFRFDYNQNLIPAEEHDSYPATARQLVDLCQADPAKLNLITIEAAGLLQSVATRSDVALKQNWLSRTFNQISGRTGRMNLENAADLARLVAISQHCLSELEARQLFTQQGLLVLGNHIQLLQTDVSRVQQGIIQMQDQVKRFYQQVLQLAKDHEQRLNQHDYRLNQHEQILNEHEQRLAGHEQSLEALKRDLNKLAIRADVDAWFKTLTTRRAVWLEQDAYLKIGLPAQLVCLANDFLLKTNFQWSGDDGYLPERCLQELRIDPEATIQSSVLFLGPERDDLLQHWLHGIVDVDDLENLANPATTPLAYAYVLQTRYRQQDRHVIDHLQDELHANGIQKSREDIEWKQVVKHMQQHAGRALDQPVPIHALLSDLIGNLFALKTYAELGTLPSAAASLPSSTKPQFPPVQSIHGWPAEKVQALQQQTAAALGKPVMFRDPLKSGGEGPEMVVIPAGKFLMGSLENEIGRSKNEGPQHEVGLVKPFAIGKYAITFEDYDSFSKANWRHKHDDNGWGRTKKPVMNISWHDAQAYCEWLSEQTGSRYRLPSEAEWEYACRAGSITSFSWGNIIIQDKANYSGSPNPRGQTVNVEKFTPNTFGLFQMHGNVWEWCQDRWHKDYQGAPTEGCAWESGNGARVARGGSYSGLSSELRSASRFQCGATDHYSFMGFRVVQDLLI